MAAASDTLAVPSNAFTVSEGELIVEKQKFPPNLTIAIARIVN